MKRHRHLSDTNHQPEGIQNNPTWNYHLSEHTECIVVGVPCWWCGRQYEPHPLRHTPDAYHQPDRTMEGQG